jgi:hypothetical protein
MPVTPRDLIIAYALAIAVLLTVASVGFLLAKL